MGKRKSLGYQIHSALCEINLQDTEKRTGAYNTLNNTDAGSVGKREFKQNKQNKEYIFSKRTAENTAEKAKTFCNFLKENYGVKMVRDISPEMARAFLDSRNASTQKTISAYKNMLYKVNTAICRKFGCEGFYTDDIDKYKLKDASPTNSKRLYTDSQIQQIIVADSKYKNELKFMSVIGCRVHELINIRVQDIDFKRMTVYIEGKGGRPSYRPIMPSEVQFVKELVKDKGKGEKVFNLPVSEHKTRQVIGQEIRRITKGLDLPVSSKCHEFRKYAAQQYYSYLLEIGYNVAEAEEITVQKLLSHGEEREDLKNIYLRS